MAATRDGHYKWMSMKIDANKANNCTQKGMRQSSWCIPLAVVQKLYYAISILF